MLSLGLLGLSAGSAFACEGYSCAPSNGAVTPPKNAEVGDVVKVKFSIPTVGNVAPEGKVIVVIKRKGGATAFKGSKSYSGGKIGIKGGKLKAGKYTVKTKFVPDADSPYAGTVERGTFRVTR